MKKLEHF
jgi:hypothetical protein